MRSDVNYIDGQPALWRDRVIEIGRRDVFVVFDIRRYQDDIIALAETASKQGATVVLLPINGFRRSPGCAHIFPAHVTCRRTGIPPPAFS